MPEETKALTEQELLQDKIVDGLIGNDERALAVLRLHDESILYLQKVVEMMSAQILELRKAVNNLLTPSLN